MRLYFPLHRQIVVGLGNEKMVLNDKTTHKESHWWSFTFFFYLRNKPWKPE